MAFIGRLFVILFALFIAAAMAGIAATAALMGAELHLFGHDPVEHVFFWFTAAVVSGVTVFAAFMPVLIAVVLAEAYRIRSLLVHMVAGAAILLFAYYGAGLSAPREESIDYPPPPISRAVEIVIAAGVAFGLTYWLIAGRNAGRWRERAASASPGAQIAAPPP